MKHGGDEKSDTWKRIRITNHSTVLRLTMGCSSSSALPDEVATSSGRYLIKNPDRFKSFDEVQSALRRAGLESSQLMIGVDCTKSNIWTGKKTFGGKSLHHISQSHNPYESVIQILGKTLSPFDDDGEIPVYGFGDTRTTNKSVFSFKIGEGNVELSCRGFEDALQCYRKVIPTISLSGPTSFSPIIEKAIATVIGEGGYHILVIIADGEISDPEETARAIVKASDYALSIITIGVGDGPWDTMEEFDDHLPARRFDNFQFVDYNKIMSDPKIENHEITFAMHALMECPDQYHFLKKNKLIKYISDTKAPGGI